MPVPVVTFNVVKGDDEDLEVVVSDLPGTQTITKAWWTGKLDASAADGTGGFSFFVTEEYVAGKGLIDNSVTFGVQVTAAAAQDAVQLVVRPLPVPLQSGQKLPFGAVTVEVTKDAAQDATQVFVRPLSATIPINTTATIRAALITFELTHTLSKGLTASTTYPGDVQVQTNAGKIKTPLKMNLVVEDEKTLAES